MDGFLLRGLFGRCAWHAAVILALLGPRRNNFPDAKGLTKVVWIADLLPDEAAGAVGSMMEQGMAVMKQTLDRLADEATNAKANEKPPA
jgi:hypothetical protein